MTIYRAVCPTCSAYVRSYDVRTPEDEDEWKEMADTFFTEHVCIEEEGKDDNQEGSEQNL